MKQMWTDPSIIGWVNCWKQRRPSVFLFSDLWQGNGVGWEWVFWTALWLCGNTVQYHLGEQLDSWCRIIFPWLGCAVEAANSAPKLKGQPALHRENWRANSDKRQLHSSCRRLATAGNRETQCEVKDNQELWGEWRSRSLRLILE